MLKLLQKTCRDAVQLWVCIRKREPVAPASRSEHSRDSGFEKDRELRSSIRKLLAQGTESPSATAMSELSQPRHSICTKLGLCRHDGPLSITPELTGRTYGAAGTGMCAPGTYGVRPALTSLLRAASRLQLPPRVTIPHTSGSAWPRMHESGSRENERRVPAVSSSRRLRLVRHTPTTSTRSGENLAAT